MFWIIFTKHKAYKQYTTTSIPIQDDNDFGVTCFATKVLDLFYL